LKDICDSIDILINNAGVFSHTEDASIETLNPQFLDLCMTVNAYAPIILTHYLYELLEAAPFPIVLNILTDLVESVTMNGEFPAYRASKAALAAFSENEGARSGKLCVIGADPGWMRTDMGGGGAPDDPMVVAHNILHLLLNPALLKSGLTYRVAKGSNFQPH
jgi:NAD(P)-dependent dehydrogenase (short-subunit alcohol dehydrogenase family)